MARFTELGVGTADLTVPVSIKDSNADDFISFSRTGTGTARIETPQDDLSLRSARDITLFAGNDGPGNVYIGWGDAGYTPNSPNKVATVGDLAVIPQVDKYYTNNNNHYPDLTWGGKHVYFTYDGNWDAIWLPTDASLNLPIGFTFTIVTDEMMGSFVYLQADDLDYTYITVPGIGQSSNGYDIAANTIVTVMKIDNNRWIASGYGITED